MQDGFPRLLPGPIWLCFLPYIGTIHALEASVKGAKLRCDSKNRATCLACYLLKQVLCRGLARNLLCSIDRAKQLACFLLACIQVIDTSLTPN